MSSMIIQTLFHFYEKNRLFVSYVLLGSLDLVDFECSLFGASGVLLFWF
jgi:hypothetical protein